MTNPAPAFLGPDAPPVLIYGGKGGVGKTTTAAASAVAIALANPSQRVLLVSTDPAHSVRDAVGDDDSALPTNLEIAEIDAAAEHTVFMTQHAETLKQIASRGTFLDDDEIARFLDLSVPGVDELMCFLRIAHWFSEDRADRYIIDTAPTGHALRLLTMPHLLENWIAAIEALLGKHRYMAGLFGGGADDGVDDFVNEHESMFDHVAEVLSDPEAARFVAVFNAEPLSIAETARLLTELDDLEIDAPELVLNRLAPAGQTGPIAALRDQQQAALRTLPESITSRTVWACPLLAGEPRGAELASFFRNAAPLAIGNEALSDEPSTSPAVSGSLVLPRGVKQPITLVAGKGGVGKTSVSCAIALGSSAAATGRTLIVSTDPAGSLSDALGVDVGPEPTVITPTLHAVQLDADAELESLKEIYAEELEHFFDNFSVGLSFDGDALAHLLDLAPTGIDEVMALVRMTELLEEHGYERIIIDTAPTGHTLRLLELPTVVRGWLSEILGVLAHYSHVIHLPKINERLIRFSKGLNTLRTMLSDPATCDIIAVAIPTHLSTAETRRLIAGCQAAGVSVSGVVINMITPPATGEWTRLNDRETACIAELRSLAGTRSLCEITRGTPPQGPSALTTIGARLLATPTAQTRVA